MEAVLLTALSVSAKVSLPSLVGDNMVLQRNTSVNVWGKAKAGAKVSVSVSWSKERYRTKADPDGNWRVRVATADAGGPHTMTISDGEPVTVRGIMLGEVWLCCGQSNMEMPLCGFMMQPVENYPEYLMDVPTEASLIRFFQVPRVPADEPADTCGGEWLLPTMRNASQFSACGYFFGRALSKALVGVPVGLISSNWGGTRIECWMSDEAILSTEGINHEFALSGEGVTSEPHRLFNSMIWPLRHYTAKGWIWYQGESNRINWFDYRNLMVSMVDLWRNIWEDEGMPFYFVQLALTPTTARDCALCLWSWRHSTRQWLKSLIAALPQRQTSAAVLAYILGRRWRWAPGLHGSRSVTTMVSMECRFLLRPTSRWRRSTTITTSATSLS